MPRLVNAVPRYCRHKGTNQAVVTLNGHDFYLGKWNTRASRREYDRLIGEWIAGGRQFRSPTHDLTVVELVAQYVKWADRYYRRDGVPTRVLPGIKCAMRYLKNTYAELPACEFGPLRLKSLRERMVKDGLARTYVNQHVAWIKCCFKWGASEELVPATIPQALATVRGLVRGKTKAPERPPVQPVADAAVDKTLPHLPDVVADMVRVLRVTGMRPGEVCIMRPMDIDRTGDIWFYKPSSHKNLERDKPRIVCVGRQGQDVLTRYLLRAGDQFCFKPSESEQRRRAANHRARKTPASCGNGPGTNRKRKPRWTPGDRYTTQSLGKAVRRACVKAGVKPWALNRLRHSVGSRVRREYGLEHAQAVLGHSNLQTTQIYAVVALQRAIEVAKKFG